MIQTLSTITDSIFNGFTLTAILLLLGYLIFLDHRQTIKKLLVISNYLLIVGSILFFIMFVLCNCAVYQQADEFDRYALINKMSGPYWFAFWATFITKVILPHFLWIKKISQTVWSSFFLATLLLLVVLSPIIQLFVSRADFTGGFTINIYHIITFNFVLLLIFLFSRVRRKKIVQSA